MNFIHVHSQYSTLDGAASIPRPEDKAVADGMPALALTDHGNIYGIKFFYDTCPKKTSNRQNKSGTSYFGIGRR